MSEKKQQDAADGATQASLPTLLDELPYLWGKAGGSSQRLGNLGLIQELRMTTSSSSSHPTGPFSFVPRPRLCTSLPLPCLGLTFSFLCCFCFSTQPGLAGAGSLMAAMVPAHTRSQALAEQWSTSSPCLSGPQLILLLALCSPRVPRPPVLPVIGHVPSF